MPGRSFADVLPKVAVDTLERAVLRYWEDEDIFARSLARRRGRELFSFYDGPPYATGKPHYGHVLQSAIKDAVLRYKTMRGYFVPRRVGWDCHGLPVEVLVERELKLKSKRDIERIGIEAFNQKCRETVFRYIDEFTTTLKRLGRWADYDGAYATLSRDYMESEWWVFKQLWDKGLVYKDFRSTPYCIRCATPLSNFEVSMAYRQATDTAVYVALPVVGGSPTLPRHAPGLRGANQKLMLLVWTTTPWTLPGNVAVAVDSNKDYVIATGSKNKYYLNKNAAEKLQLNIEKTIKGKEIVGL
ncbi:MAG: class I tRNA ligase family protein, partial [Candidatus Andersenbacteria bacterium]|nr:class I tRNA ligase family protein [Candidatus Andersenbacteria bacterium]